MLKLMEPSLVMLLILKKMNQVVHPEHKKAHPTEILPPIVTSVTAMVTYLSPALDTKWEPQLLLSH